MNKVLKLGLILGAIGALTSIVMTTFFEPKTFFSGKSMIISLVISMAILVILGRMYLRDPETGTLSYGEALKNLFLASIIGALINLTVTTLLYQNNTEMKEAFQTYAIDAQESGLKLGMSLAGASESKINEEVEILRDKIDSGEVPLPDYPFTFSGLPMNMLNQIIFSLIMSLIAAIFVKKKEESYA